MLNKRVLFILFLLIVAFGMMSSLSADELDNATLDAIGIDDSNIEDLSIDDDINEISQANEEGSDEIDDVMEVSQEEDALSASTGTFNELQNQINRASEGDLISLSSDYSYNVGFKNTEGIIITKSLTVEGNGHKIDGLSKSRLFQISNADVTFNNVVFKNGYAAEGYGGAILGFNADINLSSCVFENNYAVSGGSIYVNNSNISSEDSSFKHSNIPGEGGAIYSINSRLLLSHINCTDNHAETAGGTIYSDSSLMVGLFNSYFSNSNSSGLGGVLSLNNVLSIVFDCIFYNCKAHDGGAIYSLDSQLNIIASRFDTCFAFYGGAVCSLNTDLSSTGNLFDYNSANYYGGSIYLIYGTLNVEYTVFKGSNAGWFGGAMYIRSPSEIKNIYNNSFLYCTAMDSFVYCNVSFGPRIYIDGYDKEIPESGSIYEDIYFLVSQFSGTLDGVEYVDYGDVLTYVLSNSDTYGYDSSVYNRLTSEFVQQMGFVKNNVVPINIHDEDHPDTHIIYLNYDTYNVEKVVYDSLQFSNEFSLRYLMFEFYNFQRTGVFRMIAQPRNVLGVSADTGENRLFYFVEYSSPKGTGLNGWWACPVLHDGTEMEGNRTVHGYIWRDWFNADDFSYNTIDGSFSFHFEDIRFDYNFGNIYDLRSYENPCSLITYEPYSNDKLPSSYDSRKYGYITPAKNQGSGGNCWAFSGIATLEACLKKATGETYDFSEENAKNLMARTSIYGLNLNPNRGGYDTMFMGYLTSWLGPIIERYNWYHPESAMSFVAPPAFHIQDISFLPVRKNSFDNDEYKRAIMDYGAISVILNWTLTGNLHSISLVGWDDNYKGVDALGNPSNGAWIFKNSWGKDWGDNGFGYLSYTQKLSEQINPRMHAYTFIFNDNKSEVGYQDIYQYDFAGLTDYLYVDVDCVYYKNKFVTRGYVEYLSAFSTYFEKDTNFTFSVRINGVDITKTDDNVTIVNSIHYSPAGYHTIPLGYNLTLHEGDEFEIVIKLLNPNVNYVPICQADKLYTKSYPHNVSFVSYDGVNWVDLYRINKKQEFLYGPTESDTCQVACIKAFATTCRIVLHNINALGTLIEYGGDYERFSIDVNSFVTVLPNKEFIVNINIPDWYSSYESYENFVKVKINDKVYYSKIKNGKAQLKLKFDKEGIYSFSAEFKSNMYFSNVVKFNFSVQKNTNVGTFSELKEIIDNAKNGSTIKLNKDYLSDFELKSQFTSIKIDKSLTIDGGGHILDGLLQSGIFYITSGCNVVFKNIIFKNGKVNYGGAINSFGKLQILSCNFYNNHAYKSGGAIYSDAGCSIVSSSFTNNHANLGGIIYSCAQCSIKSSSFNYNYADYGGVIISFSNCFVEGSSFSNNHAEYSGGAIYSGGNCSIMSSSFTNNHAGWGGAVFSPQGFVKLNIVGSDFRYDKATYNGGAIYACHILNITKSSFISNQNNEIIYFHYYYDENNNAHGNLYLKNNKMDSKNAAIFYGENEIPYDEPVNFVFNTVHAVKGEHVVLCQIKNADGNTIAFWDVNVTLTNLKDKSDVTYNIKYNNTLGGYSFDTSSLAYGDYKLTGIIAEGFSDNYSVKSGMLYVIKSYVLTSPGLTKVYGKSNKLTVTLKNDRGIAIANANIIINLNGKASTLKTNSKGQVSLAVNLVPKTYYATVIYTASSDKYGATIKAKAVIKKATPKITAKKKTFRVKTKTKKYTITLKNNLGKVMKKTKVTLKVNGKKYTAKTNSKGKATFKLKDLKKKGKFKATVKYAGNSYYKTVSKTVKITVKK